MFRNFFGTSCWFILRVENYLLILYLINILQGIYLENYYVSLFVSLFYSLAILLNSRLSCHQFTHITTHTGVEITKHIRILEVGGLNFGWGTGNLAEVLNFFPVAPVKCRNSCSTEPRLFTTSSLFKVPTAYLGT